MTQVKEMTNPVKKIVCKIIGHKIVNRRVHWHSYCLRCGKDHIWGHGEETDNA